MPEGEPGALGGAGGLDALQLEAGQGALRDGRGLLDVLEHQPGKGEEKPVQMSLRFELILHCTLFVRPNGPSGQTIFTKI